MGLFSVDRACSLLQKRIMKTTNEKPDVRNFQTAARGTRVLTHEDGIWTFGFQDLMVWRPSTQQWELESRDNDKFLVISEDRDEAIQTFWLKWKKYVSTRFGLSYIPVEAIN